MFDLNRTTSRSYKDSWSVSCSSLQKRAKTYNCKSEVARLSAVQTAPSYLHQMLVDPFREGLLLNSIAFICGEADKTDAQFRPIREWCVFSSVLCKISHRKILASSFQNTLAQKCLNRVSFFFHSCQHAVETTVTTYFKKKKDSSCGILCNRTRNPACSSHWNGWHLSKKFQVSKLIPVLLWNE